MRKSERIVVEKIREIEKKIKKKEREERRKNKSG